MAEKVEQPRDEQPPAKPEAKKPVKKAKQPKQKKQDDDVYLPILAEFTFASSAIFLILVFLAMAGISWLTGTSLLDFVLRTSAAIVMVGSLLMSVTRQVTTEVLNTSMDEVQKELEETIIEELSERESPKRLKHPEEAGSADTPEDLEPPLIAEAQ